MRIALISDIHGNSVALDAVLADMRDLPTDLVVCLGDIAAGGPDPVGAIDRLRDLDHVAVQGNTDAGMVDMPEWWRDPASRGIPDDAAPGLDISVWTAEQLSSDQQRYLAGLPLTTSIDLTQGGDLLAFHGSPRSADDTITASTSPEELDRMISGFSEGVLVGGHTHVPLLRMHGTRLVANPGSVGMPFAAYGYAGGVEVLPHGAYAVMTADATRIDVEFRQVAVDPRAVIRSVRRSGMPHGEWWLGLRRLN